MNISHGDIFQKLKSWSIEDEHFGQWYLFHRDKFLNFYQTLKVGMGPSYYMPYVRMTYVHATYVVVTFVHTNNISPNFNQIHFCGQKFFGQPFF